MLSAQPLDLPDHLVVSSVCRVALGHEHEIAAARKQQFVSPEGFPHQSFYAVSFDRSPELARRRDAQPRRTRCLLRQHEHEKAVGVKLAASILRRHELAAFAQPFVFVETLVRRSPLVLLLGDGDRQPLATLATTALQSQAPALRLHPLAKAVAALATLVVGLISALHGSLLCPLKMAAEL
jgi:hypothetical protein